jgi:hypothetical protein
MNHRLLLAFVLCATIAAVSGSCSDTAQQIASVDRLIGQSDTVELELSAIDPIEIETLFERSADLKERFKAHVKNDTLDFEFAEQLDRFLQANALLKGLSEERKTCFKANISIKKRLTDLKRDIGAGAGDRSGYAGFVSSETKEMTKIRKHSKSIVRRFETAKSAIEQFQPAIERFISQFVSPSNS